MLIIGIYQTYCYILLMGYLRHKLLPADMGEQTALAKPDGLYGHP